MITQEKCVEEQKETNSMHEERATCQTDTRHGGRMLGGSERPSKGVASSHKSRAGSARDGKGRRERKRGMGETGDRKKRKQHVAHCAAPATNSSSTSNNHSNCSNSSSSRSSTDTSVTLQVCR